MSQENVEFVRRAWDGWLRGDLSGLLDKFHPEIVWDTSHFRDWPESNYYGQEGVRRFLTEWRPYRGHDGVRRWWESLFAVYRTSLERSRRCESLGT